MTIEAMKQALDSLENLQPIMANGLLEQRQLDFIDPHINLAITALRAAIDQAQEPVYQITMKKGPISKVWLDVDEATYNSARLLPDEYQVRQLNLSPRQWQGLTKREFLDAVDGLEDLEDCWVAIEAKLKEKNT